MHASAQTRKSHELIKPIMWWMKIECRKNQNNFVAVTICRPQNYSGFFVIIFSSSSLLTLKINSRLLLVNSPIVKDYVPIPISKEIFWLSPPTKVSFC